MSKLTEQALIEAIENELLAKKQSLIESKNSDKAE
jgi:hypothetical protein